jgi:hypothetical protein
MFFAKVKSATDTYPLENALYGASLEPWVQTTDKQLKFSNYVNIRGKTERTSH